MLTKFEKPLLGAKAWPLVCFALYNKNNPAWIFANHHCSCRENSLRLEIFLRGNHLFLGDQEEIEELWVTYCPDDEQFASYRDGFETHLVCLL